MQRVRGPGCGLRVTRFLVLLGSIVQGGLLLGLVRSLQSLSDKAEESSIRHS